MKNTNEQKLELYQKGLTDLEIARELGCTSSNVAQWRRNRGLELHKSKGGGPLSPEEEAKRKDLYDRGFVDADIAAKCNVRPSAIVSWRRDRGLKSKHKAEKRYVYGENGFLDKWAET